MDASGAKNPIQSLSSTITYLQRHTLKLELGLSAANEDGAGGVISDAAGPLGPWTVLELGRIAAVLSI